MYRALREQDPVHWVESSKVWVVSSYETMRQIMIDDETFCQQYVNRELLRSGRAVLEQPYFQAFRRIFFLMDGEDHRRLRPMFVKWFMGPTRTQELMPMIARVTGDVLDGLEGERDFDVIGDFAYRIPLRVIGEILGVTESDSKLIAHDIELIAPVVESVPKSAEVKRHADLSIQRLYDFISDLVKSRCRNLGDDPLSSMIISFDPGNFKDEAELWANVLLMYFAGHETTTAAIGLAVLSLHRHPDQLQLLQRSPELMPIAVDELLRFDAVAFLRLIVAEPLGEQQPFDAGNTVCTRDGIQAVKSWRRREIPRRSDRGLARR